MEGKVIKFNLVGAICVIIFIVLAIVGIVVFAINGNDIRKNNIDDDKHTEVRNSEQEVLEYEKTIMINGQEQKFNFKTYKSKLGYKIDYDIDSFYIDYTGKDEFKSLYTNDIFMNISKVNEDFSKKTESLIKESSNKMKENSNYSINQINLHGKLCIREENIDGNNTLVNYYIEDSKGYFVIEFVCGKELKDSMIQIVDEMVKTFEFM